MNNQPGVLQIRSQYLGEPLLEFADGREHIDPKLGISRFGPKSYSPRRKHPSHVQVGFIGSAETMAASKGWIESSSKGILGDEKHPEFPGCKADRGFFTQLDFDDDWQAQIHTDDIDALLGIKRSRERFEELLKLLEGKLDSLAKKDQPPEYIVIALPDELYNKCKVTNYRDPHIGGVHRDLRRAFKALAMKYRIPTQFLRQQTIDGREKDHASKVAWNFFTGLYFKSGGTPWGPTQLTPGTCYIGVAFYRSLGSLLNTMQTSIIQAFDEHGDGLVLRGPEFDWNVQQQGTKSPHLTEQQAELLMSQALDKYQEYMHQTPQRVVLHKSSIFWPEEKTGFKKALKGRIKKFDFLAIDTRQSAVRLLTQSTYPPLRGTRFTVGDVDFLYTTGFIAELGQYHSLHVPSPIQIADYIGQDTPREDLLREVLILTKMNWNSSRLGGKSPITLRFSDLVGDIMKEIPVGRDPLPQYKFYM